MGRKRLIFEIRNIEESVPELIEQIDKAVLAAAFKIRDDARTHFMSSKSQYKYATSNYNKLANGIMVGKLTGSSVKVHSLGNKGNNDTWKTRFFVGGTTYRTQTQQEGVRLNKPYTKGFIQDNTALDKAVAQNQNILSEFIGNVINNDKK